MASAAAGSRPGREGDRFTGAKRMADAPVNRSPFPASRTSTASLPERPPVVDPDFKPEPMTSFKVGDRIEHNRFGAGQILEISGNVPDLKAKVRFEQYGEKLLLLKFAKIRHK